jgi:hypothetical protein
MGLLAGATGEYPIKLGSGYTATAMTECAEAKAMIESRESD